MAGHASGERTSQAEAEAAASTKGLWWDSERHIGEWS